MSDIHDTVRAKYGSVAASDLTGDSAGVRAVAEAFGYEPGQLAAVPAEANMGLSCGNPTAFAALRPGETVLDLGCGGGLDVFLAAGQVGPTGKAIGVDMTPQMIERAKRAAAEGVKGRPITNVEFHVSEIESLPLPDASVDCVISNCVINLVPDKPAALREIARVLKPGGRLAISDIALKRPLPPEIAQDALAYVGCIAGAISIDDYRRGLREAGFAAVEVVDTGADLNAYTQVEGQSGCCSPKAVAVGSSTLPIAAAAPAAACGSADAGAVHGGLTALLDRYDVNEYAASVRVYAVKP